MPILKMNFFNYYLKVIIVSDFKPSVAYSFTKFQSLATQVGLALPLSGGLRYKNSLFNKTILAKICILFRSLTFGRTKKRFL